MATILGRCLSRSVLYFLILFSHAVNDSMHRIVAAKLVVRHDLADCSCGAPWRLGSDRWRAGVCAAAQQWRFLACVLFGKRYGSLSPHGSCACILGRSGWWVDVGARSGCSGKIWQYPKGYERSLPAPLSKPEGSGTFSRPQLSWKRWQSVVWCVAFNEAPECVRESRGRSGCLFSLLSCGPE